MILPNKEDTLPFLCFTEKEFEEWLLKGMKEYVEKKNVWAFEPIAVFIGQDDMLCLDLRNVYEALPSQESQNFFREAVVKLLDSEKVSIQHMTLEALEELYYLAGLIGIKLTPDNLEKIPQEERIRFEQKRK